MARPKSSVKKKHLNVYISQELADGFREISDANTGKLNVCLSAAMLMFMESDEETQAKLMNRIMEADLRGEFQTLVMNAKSERNMRQKTNHKSS
jgi:hypothetical protein